MTPFPLTLVATLLAFDAAASAPAPGLSRPPHPQTAETRCAACHSTEGWSAVSFAHDRTGFPLTGRHRNVGCRPCHPGDDFGRVVARACAACHRDVHLGRMGTRCDGCHGTEGWNDEPFGPEPHRRTDFPLTGRHAVVPCQECHGERRDRSFARATTRCIGCHELDFTLRAAAAGTDHVAAGFGEDCRQCHGTWRFSHATFPAHEACFQIAGGPHSGVSCRGCHDAGMPSVATSDFSCASDTADCLRCHTMPGIGTKHAGVAGFYAANRRCYECHRFGGATP